MTLRITLSTINLAKGIVYLQTNRKKLQTIYKYSPYLHPHISVFLRHKFVADCDPLCSGLYLLIKPKQCINLSWLFSGQYFIYIEINNYHWVEVAPGNTYHNQDTVCLLTKNYFNCQKHVGDGNWLLTYMGIWVVLEHLFRCRTSQVQRQTERFLWG